MVKLKTTTRYFLGVAGIMGSVGGIMIMIPSMLKENYVGASLAGALVMIGIILLAISWAD